MAGIRTCTWNDGRKRTAVPLEIYWEIMERVYSFLSRRHRLFSFSFSLSGILFGMCVHTRGHTILFIYLLCWTILWSLNWPSNRQSLPGSFPIIYTLIFLSTGSSYCFPGHPFARLTLSGFVPPNDRQRIAVENCWCYFAACVATKRNPKREYYLFQDSEAKLKAFLCSVYRSK